MDLKTLVNRARQDIHFFAEHILNIKNPTWQQASVWDMVQAAQYGLPAPAPRSPHNRHGGTPAALGSSGKEKAHRQIAIASGQGPGKTFASVVIMSWRAFRAPGKSVVTAPGMRQCQEVWLSEFRKILSKSHPVWQKMCEVTATRVTIGNDPNWVIHCVTSTDEKKLQGFHDDGLTILCEEMSGIRRPIIEQFQGTLSNHDCMLIGIGNPNLRDCAFYDCFTRNRYEWQTYQIDAEETARYRPDIVDPSRNERLERQYGRDSDIYRVRVRGLFPKSDPDSVFALEDLQPLTETPIEEAASVSSTKVISIDFARFGTNETVIYQRMGNAIIDQRVMNRVEPAFAVATAFEMQRAAGWRDDEVTYIPDATGMGQGVLFMFYNESKRTFEFHGGGSPNNKRAFSNRNTEAWFHFKEKIKNEIVHIPKDDRLMAQLVSRKYRPTEKGQFKVESKQDYSRRIEEDSPDRADALLMAFYDVAFEPAQVATKGPNDDAMSGMWL